MKSIHDLDHPPPVDFVLHRRHFRSDSGRQVVQEFVTPLTRIRLGKFTLKPLVVEATELLDVTIARDGGFDQRLEL
jgi:hypothetical protein